MIEDAYQACRSKVISLFQVSTHIIIVSYFYWPTNALNYNNRGR